MKNIGYRSNKGFNLLEVMIALFVLAIGMLGILKMQTQSVRHNKTAYLYSQAGFFAQDIIERMRANKTGLASYLGTASGGAASCEGAGIDCSSDQLAEWDVSEWYNQLIVALPTAESKIEMGALGNQVKVTIQFEDRRDQDVSASEATGVLQEYVVITEL